MTITIPDELEEQLRHEARSEGISVEAYVERLLREGGEWVEQFNEPLDDSDPEYVETRNAVGEGLEEAERGEGRPAEEVLRELRSTDDASR